MALKDRISNHSDSKEIYEEEKEKVNESSASFLYEEEKALIMSSKNNNQIVSKELSSLLEKQDSATDRKKILEQ